MIQRSRIQHSRSLKSASACSTCVRRGLTLIEVLVCVGILLVIVAMATPWLQVTRSHARVQTCQYNMRQLWIGFNIYYDAHSQLPAGAISELKQIPAAEDVDSRSLFLASIPALLPPQAQGNLPGSESLTALSWDSEPVVSVRQTRIPRLLCPADQEPPRSVHSPHAFQSSYGGSYSSKNAVIEEGTDGVLTLNKNLTWDDLIDGTSQTLLAGEFQRTPEDLGWASGTFATLRNTSQGLSAGGQANGFGSFHSKGTSLMFADGTIRMTATAIDLEVLQQLARRNDTVGDQADRF